MDILSISDLLNAFITQGVLDIERSHKNNNLTHPTTIGESYEGLTREVVQRAIFKGLNLKVVKNSFIKGCPKEFDVMLVEGEGEQISFSDRYFYQPEQVLAILSVRKSVFSKDVRETFANLQFIINYYSHVPAQTYTISLVRDAFRGICRKNITARAKGELTTQEDLILSTLWVEAQLPVRIVWGYNGFKSEYNFRESLEKFLIENLSNDVDNIIPGFGPHNFPNLIMCGKYSMIKANGMPISLPSVENNWWPFYVTSSKDSTRYFLELIWTKISYRYGIIDIFGEDLEVEEVNRFLDTRLIEKQGRQGWEYSYYHLPEYLLNKELIYVPWEPIEIDPLQHTVIKILSENETGELDLSVDYDLSDLLDEQGYKSWDEFVQQLLQTGLVTIESNSLKLLTNHCSCVIVNGKHYAAENKSGRLTRWFENQVLNENTQ